MSATPEPGSISWQDLTVADAERVRDFYQAVVGWKPEALSMGAYSDFVMNADGTPTAGICHARGANAELPPVWLVYITVEDLDHSLDECTRLGGSLVSRAAQLRRRPLLRHQGSRRRAQRALPATRRGLTSRRSE